MDALAVIALVAGLVVGAGIGLVVARGRQPAGREPSGAPAQSLPAEAAATVAQTPPPGPTPAADAAVMVPPAATAATAGSPEALLGDDAMIVADAIAAGILHFDERLTVTYANAGASGLLRRSPDALVGRTVLEVFLAHDVETLLLSALAGAAPSAELQLREREVRSLVMRARRSPSGGVWLVIDDVSELRRLQQIRAEFIDNISHELRTPLTTVSLLAETLSREAAAAGDAVPARMRDRIAKIEEETGHLVQMVNELLDLSRIESGPPLALPDEVDVRSLAEATAERLRLFADRQGVHLSVDAAEPVPAVRGDEDRLGQALLNLLHNAVKFSPDGGDVTIHVRAAEGIVTIAVEDQGIGVSRADQARIFERFYKADRARVRGGGTGLGLSIARHIVEAHGGHIRLESEVGRGSTFFVELPAAGSPSMAPREAPS